MRATTTLKALLLVTAALIALAGLAYAEMIRPFELTWLSQSESRQFIVYLDYGSGPDKAINTGLIPAQDVGVIDDTTGVFYNKFVYKVDIDRARKVAITVTALLNGRESARSNSKSLSAVRVTTTTVPPTPTTTTTTTTTIPPPPPAPVLCDANGDGKVTTIDALACLRQAVQH